MTSLDAFAYADTNIRLVAQATNLAKPYSVNTYTLNHMLSYTHAKIAELERHASVDAHLLKSIIADKVATLKCNVASMRGVLQYKRCLDETHTLIINDALCALDEVMDNLDD